MHFAVLEIRVPRAADAIKFVRSSGLGAVRFICSQRRLCYFGLARCLRHPIS